MFTDRDFYRSILTGALENFGVNTLAVILNVPAVEVTRWAQGRSRPPARQLLQVIDLMWPKSKEARPGLREDPSRRVLVAVPAEAGAGLQHILAKCPVELVTSLDEGVDALKRNAYSHIIVGYLFAESRMFEFAQRVRELQPEAQVLCVKAGGRMLGAEVRAGLDEAAVQLGCEGFFDLTAGRPETLDRVFDEILGYFVADLRVAVQDFRSIG